MNPLIEKSAQTQTSNVPPTGKPSGNRSGQTIGVDNNGGVNSSFTNGKGGENNVIMAGDSKILNAGNEKITMAKEKAKNGSAPHSSDPAPGSAHP